MLNIGAITKHFRYIIPSILFFALLEFFFKSFGFSYASLFMLFAVSAFSAFWITKYRFLPVILIALFSTSSVIFLLTLGKENFQYPYIIISSAMFMLALIGLNKFFVQGEDGGGEKNNKGFEILDSGFNLSQTIILISVFLLSSGIYGIYVDLNLPVWVIMSVIFACIFLSTFYLARINFLKSKELELHLDSARNKTFLLYSFLSGLLVSELVWAISFLPANHLTAGAIILCSYYVFWNILRDYLRNNLTKKNVYLNLIFFAAFGSLIIIASKWDIV